MASCYWAQPGQLHPWYKLDTLKRKLPPMFPRSESPSPVDEYDDDLDPARAKRRRRITLDQARPTKRKLPSPPQSPTATTEEPGQSERGGDTHLVKRQRCTTLERRLEGLSLAAPPARAQAQAQSQVSSTPTLTLQAQAAPDFSTRLSLPPLAAAAAPPPVSALPLHHHYDAPPPDFTSLRWPEMSASPTMTTVSNSYSISSLRPPPLLSLPPPPFPISTPITPASSAHALTVDTDAIADVKMRSSSWYEPQKDRIVVTDLDASSDDDADIVDDAPKLPRSVLEALLRGPGGLLLSPVLPQLASQSLDPLPLLDLDPGSLFESGLDEAMDVEQ